MPAEMRCLLNQQNAFFQTFLENQRTLIETVVAHHKHQVKEITRLTKIIEKREASSAPEPEHENTADITDENLDPEFEFQGINLLNIPREKFASQFGRNLGRVIFGEKEKCELIHSMISPNKSQETARKKCDERKKELFTKVVKKKYAKNPGAAYISAREAANQMGRELRTKFLKSPASNNLENCSKSSSADE